jgi:predicted HTH domain antitoxin
MSDTVVEIHLSSSLLQFGLDQEEVQRRVTEWLVLSLFTEERISSGKAARLLNISRIDFLALLQQRGIAYIDYSEDELADEFTAVEIMEVSRNMTGGNLSDPTISDEAIEGLRQRLGPLDPHQIAAWQAMNPVRRLELAFQAYQFALDVVRLTERQRSADLPSDEFAWRVTRRMQGNPHLGR